MVRPALMPASPGALFFASIGLNIILLLLTALGNGQPYVFTRELIEKTDLALAEHAESISSDLNLEQSLGFSGRGQGGEGCTMCGVAPLLCDDIGENNLNKAISYGGSNDRLRRVLAKIKAGEPFSIGVIGGSVSQANGLAWGGENDEPHEPWYRPDCMHRIIFEHLHSLSPLSADDPVPFDSNSSISRVGSASGERASFYVSGKKEGKNSLVNGALGATGSGYFAYCWGHHVPEDADLYIVELSINDEFELRNSNTYELLVRDLLDLPHKPAVLYVDIFALEFDTMGLGGELHKGVNQYYDIPSISIRNPFLPQAYATLGGVEQWFHRMFGEKGGLEGIDLRHISEHGHARTAELVNAYIDVQLCEMDRRSALRSIRTGEAKDARSIEEQYPVVDVPLMRINHKWALGHKAPHLKPQCQSMNFKKNALKPLMYEGWRTWSHGEKNYWISTVPGSTISFAFSTTVGEVQLHYLASQSYGLGTAKCWIDDNKDRIEWIPAYWDNNANISQSRGFPEVTPGDHVMTCELAEGTNDPGGGHEFRIISVTSV